MNKAIEIDSLSRSKKLFSVCTLVRDNALYQKMLDAFQQAGFSGDRVEYLYVDNTQDNKYDAYEGGWRLITAATGQYIIFCHEDIKPLESIQVLEQRLNELDLYDSNWGVCGNAGGFAFGKLAIRISDANGKNRHIGAPYPKKVFNLDENFLVIKKEALLAPSRDLKGFHFYGTDICLQGYIRGWSSYVIDYHVLHSGGASLKKKELVMDAAEKKFNNTFFQTRQALVNKYSRLMKARWFHSANAKFFLCGNRLFNFLGNRKIIFSLVRRIVALKYK